MVAQLACKLKVSTRIGQLPRELLRCDLLPIGGEGIVTKGVDNTIRNVGILASEGMRETDRTILSIMTRPCD